MVALTHKQGNSPLQQVHMLFVESSRARSGWSWRRSSPRPLRMLVALGVFFRNIYTKYRRKTLIPRYLAGCMLRCMPSTLLRTVRIRPVLPPAFLMCSCCVAPFLLRFDNLYLIRRAILRRTSCINRYKLVWRGRSLAEHFPGLFASQRP